MTSCRPELFCKYGFNKFTKFTGKHQCQGLFFIKKETLGQVFTCKLCEIFKNTFFCRTPLVDASVMIHYHFTNWLKMLMTLLGAHIKGIASLFDMLLAQQFPSVWGNRSVSADLHALSLHGLSEHESNHTKRKRNKNQWRVAMVHCCQNSSLASILFAVNKNTILHFINVFSNKKNKK